MSTTIEKLRKQIAAENGRKSWESKQRSGRGLDHMKKMSKLAKKARKVRAKMA
jgi:hypothetical protein